MILSLITSVVSKQCRLSWRMDENMRTIVSNLNDSEGATFYSDLIGVVRSIDGK